MYDHMVHGIFSLQNISRSAVLLIMITKWKMSVFLSFLLGSCERSTHKVMWYLIIHTIHL